MEKRHRKLILVLLLILASAWVGGCRTKKRPTKPPTPQSTATSAPVEDSGPPIQETAPEADNWLRAHVIPFDSAEPGSDFDDLMLLKDIIGDARIVALGEATHGTREFFLMKHRLLEFLVKEMGFNVFAIEATWPESNLVNDYVLTGQGDPARRLEGLYFWTWNTQEVLDMIHWMRAHNEDHGDAPRVSFLGFDMQYPGMAMDNVVEYLEQVDPDMAAQATDSYECFRRYKDRQQDYTGLPPATQAGCRENLQAVYDGLGQRRGGYEAQSSPEAFALALQSARVVLQAEDVFASEDYAARDRYMAENTAWLLDQAGPDAKIVLWAHNNHVGSGFYETQSMGDYLRERYGDEMVTFGFAFYQGAFNAFSMGSSGRYGMTEFQIALPPQGSYEHYLHSAGLPHFFLDMRTIQAGAPGADWFLARHPFRSLGAAYDQHDPKAFFNAVALPQAFDVLIYFQDTSASQLLGMQATSGGPPPVQPTDFGPENPGFESGMSGWTFTGEQEYAIGSTSTVAHQGNGSGYVWSMRDDPAEGGTLMQTLWAISDYQGQRLRMSAYVKTEGVEEQAGLWLRVDTVTETVAFDNMAERPILGDTDWTRYGLVLDVPADSVVISFGALLKGAGRVWVDDFQFQVVGQDVPTTQVAEALLEPSVTPEPVEVLVEAPVNLPVFEPADCQFETPPGYAIECGYLIVPQDRSQPGGAALSLHVAIFKSRSPNPAPDPVIHLVGGPGGSLLDVAALYLEAGGDEILQTRDYIMFNQRGGRYGTPFLECPGHTAFKRELAGQELSWEEREARTTEFLLGCHDDLLERGINLSAFNSAENAADVNDLRVALGYEQVNLYGISYGSRLALTVMRDHPGGVRSAIIDGVWPPQANVNQTHALNVYRAFSALFEDCAADPYCSQTYPNLETLLYQVVDELNVHPVSLQASDGDVVVDGYTFLDTLFKYMYSAEAVPWIPNMIADASQGVYEASDFEVRDRSSMGWGMHYSVWCREELAFESPDEALALAADLPPQFRNLFATSPEFNLCESWESGIADPVENEPVVSDIPTLVLSGRYDPVTPSAWGALAAETLSNGFFYEFPGLAHGAMRSDACALKIGLQFLDDPTTEPDASCMAELTAPDFK